MPGPGAYQYKIDIGGGPKITIGERFGKKDSVDTPGPSTYSPNKEVILERKAAIGIGYGSKTESNFNVKKEPGPGEYATSELSWNGGFTFSKALRDKNATTAGPGPAKYELPSTLPDLPPHEKAKLKQH
jgi:hypothetical protein